MMRNLRLSTPLIMSGSIVVSLALGGCSSAHLVSSASTSPSVSQEAGGYLGKHAHVCFYSTSVTPVGVGWPSGRGYGLNGHEGLGTIKPDSHICGEGPTPQAVIVFEDGLEVFLRATSPIVGYPGLYFTSDFTHINDEDSKYVDEYAGATYSTSESVVNEVEGHHIQVKRIEDTGWINFEVTILD